MSETIGDLTDDQLECRDLGHSWRHYQDEAPLKLRTVVEVVRWMQCDRCETQRKEQLWVHLKTGQVEKHSQRYVYADGYRLPAHTIRSRGDVWGEVLRRTGALDMLNSKQRASILRFGQRKTG